MRSLLRPIAIFRKVLQSNRAVQLKHPFTTALVWRAMEDKESLKKRLTPLQYHVTQEAGTERPFTGCFNKFYEEGMYVCVVCRQELFSSKTKYDSGCGWPAFNDVLAKEKVTLHQDTSAVGNCLVKLIYVFLCYFLIYAYLSSTFMVYL
ncbi:PREDICTED: methionine-R-sulfoxide reductase B1 isoform X3 [Papilio xuthus]|uniref:peptide-methionine (R)-S-oxide reductase n=1 Tax=Papilio xuthus TaxID=66420 RepID=A0AAJ6Z8F8_PAPXU|nr:PREDICTED: methionine-R-sulfoxide reductase B1 isoform X3 [Papilio xuthus]